MRARRWQLIISITLTVGVAVLAYLNRAKIRESFVLLREAQPIWVIAALLLIVACFFCASLVYRRVLDSLGYRMSALQLWATALVAILLSQAVPAGGAVSYAFLVQNFRRRNIPAGHAALLASLEALSYVIAMLLFFFFSLMYLALYAGVGAAEEASFIAAGVGAGVVTGAVFVLTRNQESVTRLLLHAKNQLARVLRRNWSDEPILNLVDELARGRALIAARRTDVVVLVGIQLVALIGHSMAMMLVLRSLGATTSLFVVMTAFGIALVTSTFNVLPGGGGTVEATLVLTLQSLGVGPQAITAAVIFRIINFWLLVPVAAVCYRWLLHGRTEPAVPPVAADSPSSTVDR